MARSSSEKRACRYPFSLDLVKIAPLPVRETEFFRVCQYLSLFAFGFVLAFFHVAKTIYDGVAVLFVTKIYFCQLAVHDSKTPSHCSIKARLTRDIADKIEADLQYPGEIKVSVIRETRVIEYAR